ATQIVGAANEGGKGQNIWDYWYKTEPNRFFDGVGPESTSDFYHSFKEDIHLLKEIGHNTFRMSISWSRLIPGGRGEVNQEAVTFYKYVMDELIANYIEPFVNVFHLHMPFELQNEGRCESTEVVDVYTVPAHLAFNLFGHRVSKWFTFNEPIVH